VTAQEATRDFQAEKLRLARETGDFSALSCDELFALCRDVAGVFEQYSPAFTTLYLAATHGRRDELVRYLATKGIWPAARKISLIPGVCCSPNSGTDSLQKTGASNHRPDPQGRGD
jgi:hypothetical protein